MKKVILLILMSFATSAKAQSYLTLSQAKEIANTYYGSLQQMAKHPTGDIAFQNEERLLNVLGVDKNGKSIKWVFRVPNDLEAFTGKHGEGNKSVSITNYIGDFLRIAEEKKLDFSYNMLSNDYQYGPEIKKSNETPLYARVVVQKTMKSSRFPIAQVIDTMFINTQSRSISLITNQFRRSGLRGASMTIDELLAEAQNMYSNKRYDEAYRLYQKVLEKNPKHEEASYNLGVMSFKGEGCKQYPRKVRDYLVDFYWQKSNKGIEQLILNYNTINVNYTGFSGWESDPFPSNRLLAGNPKKKRIGFISKQGKMVIKQQYNSAFPFFNNGTAIVMSDKNEWFLIDTMGKVKDVYLRVKAVEGGKQLLVHKEDKSGVINRKTGEWDVPFINKITAYVEIGGDTKRYIVYKDGKYGIVSSENIAIVPIIFNSITSIIDFEEDKRTFLCDYDKSAFSQLLEKYEKSYKIPMVEIKKIGTVLQTYPVCTDGNTIMKMIKSDKTEWLMMDAEGRVNTVFDSGDMLYNCTYIHFSKDGKDGVFDYTTGEWVVPLIYPRRSVEICAYCCNENDEIIFFSVNNESAYERLKKKYNGSSNIPDNELKKIGTLYKLPRNSK